MPKIFLALAFIVAASATTFAQLPMEKFEVAFPPAGWTLADYLPGGSNFQWGDNVSQGKVNWTGGTGMCAHAESDDNGNGAYDIALITPSFMVPFGGLLEYDSNFQNYDGELANVDLSIDGCATWTNLVSWTTDHGGFEALPGQHVAAGLGAYVGQNANVRFHYVNQSTSAWDWYWQVDNVVVTPEPASLLLLGLAALALRRR